MASQYTFHTCSRTALEVGPTDVQQTVAKHALQALTPYDKEERRRGFVNAELGMQSDIENYLLTNLVFSFNLERVAAEVHLLLMRKFATVPINEHASYAIVTFLLR